MYAFIFVGSINSSDAINPEKLVSTECCKSKAHRTRHRRLHGIHRRRTSRLCHDYGCQQALQTTNDRGSESVSQRKHGRVRELATSGIAKAPGSCHSSDSR